MCEQIFEMGTFYETHEQKFQTRTFSEKMQTKFEKEHLLKLTNKN